MLVRDDPVITWWLPCFFMWEPVRCSSSSEEVRSRLDLRRRTLELHQHGSPPGVVETVVQSEKWLSILTLLRLTSTQSYTRNPFKEVICT